jgi:hypothetical protein
MFRFRRLTFRPATGTAPRAIPTQKAEAAPGKAHLPHSRLGCVIFTHTNRPGLDFVLKMGESGCLLALYGTACFMLL